MSWPLLLSRAACACFMACAGPLGMPGTARWTRTTENPSFPCTLDRAIAELRAMRDEPRPLARPLLICAGFFDPGPGAAQVRKIFSSITTTPEKVIAISFLTCRTFEACRERVLRELEARFPSGSAASTVEVDAVGISMGGIVARFAAMPPGPNDRRLDLHTLYTIGTPHTGAAGAFLGFFDSRARNMKPGTPFLSRLNAASVPHPRSTVAYVRLGDTLVGAERARWIDGSVRWLPNLSFQLPHAQSFDDPRILADIARRVRREPPISAPAPASLPPAAR